MISRETVSRIRERADIAVIVGETVKLTRRGRHMVGLCPFHKEKTPSFHVTPENGRFYCFGCHEHGSVIDFVMKLEGLEFPEALRHLAERIGLELEEDRSGDAGAAGARAAKRAAQDLYDVLSLAASWFERQLREHPTARVAREELARRALKAESPTDPVADALQAFRVGYAPAGWDSLATWLRSQSVSPAAAESVGLIAPRKSGGGHYDFFRNRLMFAIVDVQGRVVGFSGRILPDPETGDVDKNTGKYVNSPESPVYRKGQVVFGLFQARQAIRQKNESVVVEGNFDVVSLHARGLRHVVAPLGTAFTEQQARQLKRFAPRAVLLFDGDAAGVEAARKSRQPCREAGLDTKVAVLPKGHDPDDFVRTKGPEALERVIGSAKGMLEFLIDLELDKGFARRDAREQAERVKQVAQILAQEDDPTVRAMAKRYADSVAARMGITDGETLRTLEQLVNRELGVTAGGERRGGGRERSAARDDSVPLDMLGCVLDFPEILLQAEVESSMSFLEGEIALAAGLAHKLLDMNKTEAVESFLALLPQAIHEFAAQRLASPRHTDADQARLEFVENAQKLKRRGVSREHALVVEQISRADAQGDVERESDLLLEAVRKHRERLGMG